jgi:hypothetical protein
MRHRLSLRRAAQAITGGLCLFVLACSGDKGPTGPGLPDDDPGPVLPTPDPAPEPQPGPGPGPDPQQPGWQFPGAYQLTSINQSTPGQLVTIANAAGQVIGLYRFRPTTTLTLAADGTFALSLAYSDDKTEFVLEDEGTYAWQTVEGGILIQFSSAVYGDVFRGAAAPDLSAAFDYDFDGDGQAETRFGFQQLGGD